MECPQCHRQPVEGAAFCNYCGTRLQKVCPNCQAPNPPESSFCHRCGTRVAPKTWPAERPPGTAVETPVALTLGSTCPRCQSTNEPGSRYCFRCGLPLTEVPARAPALSPKMAAAVGTPAGFWIRTAAYVIDNVVVFVVTILLVAVVMGVSYFDTAETGLFDLTLTDALSGALGALYFTVGVSAWGTTIGKRVFGLYVTRTDGSRIGATRALARYLLYSLSAIIFFVGFIMIGVRSDKRGLHDLICDTQVVRRR